MDISTILKEDNGTYSAIRFVMVMWGVGTLVAWLVACIGAKTLVEIPVSVQTILGLLFGGKVVQKYGESKVPTAPDTTQG